MPSTIEYRPEPLKIPKRVTDEVKIPVPMDREKEQQRKLLPLMLMIGMPVFMLGMMVIMVSSGMRGNNPMMMMMMPMMAISMLSGMIMQFGGPGSGSDGDLDGDLQAYYSDISNKRTDAHNVQRSQHRIATHLYPNPRSLPTAVRLRHPSMWTAQPPAPGSTTDHMLAAEGADQTVNTWMRPRAGVGIAAVSPAVTTEEDITKAPEHLDATSYQGAMNFLSVQNLLPNTPLPIDLDYPSVGMRGHLPYCEDFVRGAVMSLAFSHNPKNLMIAVVADEGNTTWDWIKWLPHNNNRFTPEGPAGFASMRWQSFNDAVTYLGDRRELLQQENIRVIVIVDLPEATLRVPRNVANRLENVTLIVVDAFDDQQVTNPETNIHVSDEPGHRRSLSAFTQDDVCLVDEVPIELATRFAREMAPLRPPGFRYVELMQLGGPDPTAVSAPTTPVKQPTIQDALGVKDFEKWDVVARWRSTEREASFNTPIGFQVERNRNNEYVPTGELAYLDILEVASGGSGPHGMFQGGTGTGKSYLIRGIFIIWATLYSPRRINFILADFKGGATFNDVVDLPHVQANITNLGGSLDVAKRLRDVLMGENERRQQIFKDVGVANIQDYRKASMAEEDAGRPGYEPLPDLVFLADELAEFLEANPWYSSEVFDSIARVGRTAGIHLLLGTQVLSDQMLGKGASGKNNYHFGLSLKVTDAQASQLVVGDGSATKLPPARIAVLRTSSLQDVNRVHMQGFHHEAPYVVYPELPQQERKEIEPAREEKKETRRRADLSRGSGQSVSLFTQESFAGVGVEVNKEDSRRGNVIEHVPEETDDGGIETDRNVFQTLVKKITDESGDYASDVHKMWSTPLHVPMSLADVSDEEMAPPEKGISIRVGDIDMPYLHRRIPLEIPFNDSINHLIIGGDSGTGRSTVIKTLVASSGVRYPGTTFAWFLYDYAGTSLSAMENYPNTAIYATRHDEDSYRRILGEIKRLVTIRSGAMGTHRFTSVQEYFDKRESVGITNDPYQYIGFAIDGLQAWYEDTVKMDYDAADEYKKLFESSARVGIYLIGTATNVSKLSKFESLFNQGVRLYASEAMNSFNGTMRGLRDAFANMPQRQPGRVIDFSQVDAGGQPTDRHGLIMLPIMDPVQPSRIVNGEPEYDTRVDFTPEIRELGESLKSSPIGESPAPELEVIGNHVSFEELWSRFNVDSIKALPQKDRPIPFGIDTATNTPFLIDPRKDRLNARFMALAGSTRSGRTNSLVTIMEATSRLYSPEEARFVVLDGGGGLIDVYEHFIETGHMKKTSYAMVGEQVENICNQIAAVAQSRTPDAEKVSDDPKSIAERTYFSGPEMFVFLDGTEGLFGETYSPGPVERMFQSIPPNLDVGIRIFFTLPGNKLPTLVTSNKGMRHLIDNHNLYYMLHSGPASAGAITSATKTRFKELPAGRAQLHDATRYTTLDVPIIQIAKTNLIE